MQKLMRNIGVIVAVLSVYLSLSSIASAGPLPAGWTCLGYCGEETTSDGVVTLPAPSGSNSFQWVSTYGGVDGGGTLPVGPTGQESNGSYMQSTTFSVTAGDKLKFDFNYITSEGAGAPDYAWAGLFSGTSTFDSYLFTARTTTSGDTVPGFGLPGLGAGVNLTPYNTPMIPGAPTFSPLGASSGSCFIYCGHTGWISLDYTFTANGIFSLAFGVTNAFDTKYDSALAVSGITVSNIPGVPEPGTLSLLGLSLAGVSALRRRRSATRKPQS